MKPSGIFEYMTKYRYENLLLCQDRESDFKAVIAIHSTVLGPAAGGTRMWLYGDETEAIEDALRLARGMTYKYAAAGVNLGGGKAVILADPRREDREIIFRTLGKFINRLGGKFYTGEDVGTTLQDMEYLYMETPYVITRPQDLGGLGPISPLTAFGVIQGMRACARTVFGSDDLKGKVVAVQGVGAVGSALVEQLGEAGAEVIVTDTDPAKVKAIVQRFRVQAVPPEGIYDAPCHIFAPCALGAILNETTIPRLKCKLVCGAANNQLGEERHADLLAERGIFYAPDYIVNAGGAIYDADRLFYGVNYDRGKQKVAKIYKNTEKVIRLAQENGLSTCQAADRMAEQRIQAIGHIKQYWESREIR